MTIGATSEVTTFTIKSDTGEVKTFKFKGESMYKIDLRSLFFVKNGKTTNNVYYGITPGNTKDIELYTETSNYSKIVKFLETIANAVNTSGKEKDDVIDDNDLEEIEKNGLKGFTTYPASDKDSQPQGRVRDEKNNFYFDYMM